MADPTAVKRALRALAYGPTDSPSHRHLVDRATEALASVDDAARFCESTGTTRLREAVRRAEERGEQPLVERGRETLATLEAYRQAAAGASTTDEDHCCSGRGTPLPSAGQGGDR